MIYFISGKHLQLQIGASWKVPMANKLPIKLNILWVFIIVCMIMGKYLPCTMFCSVDDDDDANDMWGVFKHVYDPRPLDDTVCLSWPYDVVF